MKNMQSNSNLALGILLFLLIFSHPSSTEAQEVEDEREFDYTRGGPIGPEKWGDIKREWSLCSEGKMQSPIDMSTQRVDGVMTSYDIHRKYKPSNATLMNRGHDITIQWEGDAGSVLIDNTEYALKQAHWHSPSEHTINARTYAMELHMVHLSNDNKILVIGVLYNIGIRDEFLSKLEVSIKSIDERKGTRVRNGMIDPSDVRMSGRRYYRYIGSVTVPPCTEEVLWMISKRIRTVSKDQVKLLRDAVHDYAENNARPLQPVDKQNIPYYDPALDSKLEP